MIYILKGEIRSGKTTALKDWARGRNDIEGILCPDGDNGKRYFLNIKCKEEFELEVASENEIESDALVEIGKFKFLRSGFNKANTYLIETASQASCRYIILDEIGRLELNGEGLHFAAEVLIPKFIQDDNQHIILVVRDYLFETVLEFYSISEYVVLDKKDLIAFE